MSRVQLDTQSTMLEVLSLAKSRRATPDREMCEAAVQMELSRYAKVTAAQVNQWTDIVWLMVKQAWWCRRCVPEWANVYNTPQVTYARNL